MVRTHQAALFRLWLPTVFGASMLVVEIPLVAAAAARSTDAGRALAAIGIGLSILVVVNAPALAIAGLVAVESDRRSPRQLRRYTLLVGLAGTVALFALAVPPGSTAVRELFGLDAGVAGATSAFLAALALNSLGVAIRRHQHGRLIHRRTTGPIVGATVVRLVATAGLAWVGVALVPHRGPLIAGLALTLGAFLEAAILHAAVRRGPAGTPPAVPNRGWAALAARHGNLSAGRLLVMVPTIITTIGVARATDAPDSLVVWPVLIQLAALFTSPTTDWESVAATALRADRRDRAPRRVTAWLGAVITVAFAASFAFGLADRFVRGMLAVPDQPADVGLRWIWLLLPLPGIWIARAYLRAAVTAADETRWISYAGLTHAAVLVSVLAVLVPTGLSGVACAAVALVSGVLVEAGMTLIGTIRTGRGSRTPRGGLAWGHGAAGSRSARRRPAVDGQRGRPRRAGRPT